MAKLNIGSRNSSTPTIPVRGPVRVGSSAPGSASGSMPMYPDTSFSTYYQLYGKIGGYYAWRDKQIADYTARYNEYQWNRENEYNTTAAQLARIEEAGLNKMLAYDMATPGNGTYDGSPYAGGQGPGPLEVAQAGSSVLSGFFQNAGSLVDTVQKWISLPESKYKAALAKVLDPAIQAGVINAKGAYQGAYFNALNSIGAAGVAAGTEKSMNLSKQAKASYDSESYNMQSQMLDYLRTHNSLGEQITDFGESALAQGKRGELGQQNMDFLTKSAQYTYLMSKPDYYKALLQKAQNEGTITRGEAWRIQYILDDPNRTAEEKFVLLNSHGLLGGAAGIAVGMKDSIMDFINQLF